MASEAQPPEHPLTPAEEAESVANRAANLLSMLEPGRQPGRLFRQLARLMVINTVELVPIRQTRKGLLEVLLLQRAENDPFWPGQWHIPGAVALPTDPVTHGHDYGAPIARVMEEIGGSIRILDGPNQLETQRRVGARGHEVTVIHWGEVDGEPANGTFHNVLDVMLRLPEGNIVDGHANIVDRVARVYENRR